MYQNIPQELREYRQWVCWRYEDVNGRRTKVPYHPSGQYKASINNPATWGTFNEACVTAMGAVMDGIGFVLTEHDPYTGIDIDDKLENPASPEERDMHDKILRAFESYTERSVGGRGYHIIIRGKIAGGRDRGHVGVYSTQRYLTFSGDVVRNAPIGEYQAYLDELVKHMPVDKYEGELVDEEAVLSDREVFEMAMGAANGDKYDALCRGMWQELGYPSRSEADLALISIIGFYTRDNSQVRRLFRMTPLGQREKHQGSDKWIDRCLRIFRAKQASPADFASIKAFAERATQAVDDTTFASVEQAAEVGRLAAHAANVAEQHVPPPPPAYAPPAPVQGPFPPGLVGELAAYFYSTAVRPTYEAALAGAIGIAAGVAGRAYNISGTGLNQYLIFIAKTGTGKESIESGISKLLAATRMNVPMVEDFVGPSAFASGQGLLRVLDKRPCFMSLLGEFGLQLQAISDPRAPSATLMLRKVLLDLYGKSGWQQVLRPTAYSDTEKNTGMIHAPAVTIVGETTPESFYDGLDTNDIADGLVPRFHIIEYPGERPSRNPNAGHMPSPELVRQFATLASVAVSSAQNHACSAVMTEPEALRMLDAFDVDCDERIRAAGNAGESQLWNRAHLKALKMAALLAVGVNPHNPVITPELATWAIEFTRKGTQTIMQRFDMGDIGVGELKQAAEVRRVVTDYLKFTPKQMQAYKVDPAMHAAGVIPYAYLTVRLARIACFYKDKRGTASSLRATLEHMVQTETLGLVPPLDAQNKFGSKQALYHIGRNW